MIIQIHAFQAAAALQRAMNGQAAETEALRKAQEERDQAMVGQRMAEAGQKMAETPTLSLEEENSRLKDEVTRLGADLVAQGELRAQAVKEACERGVENGRSTAGRVAEGIIRAEREKLVVTERERDEAWEEAVRLTGEKFGLSERLSKAEHLLAAAYATPKTVVLAPSQDPTIVVKFAYYTAFANGICEAMKAGEPSTALERHFKEYALTHPLHSELLLEIRDLEKKHRVDVSWYPSQEQIIMLGEDATEHEEEEAREEAETERAEARGAGADAPLA